MKTTAIKQKMQMTVLLPTDIALRLKELNRAKKIDGIGNFIAKAVEAEFKAHKAEIMKEAINDPAYQKRCAETQRDFARLDKAEGQWEW